MLINHISTTLNAHPLYYWDGWQLITLSFVAESFNQCVMGVTQLAGTKAAEPATPCSVHVKTNLPEFCRLHLTPGAFDHLWLPSSPHRSNLLYPGSHLGLLGVLGVASEKVRAEGTLEAILGFKKWYWASEKVDHLLVIGQFANREDRSEAQFTQGSWFFFPVTWGIQCTVSHTDSGVLFYVSPASLCPSLSSRRRSSHTWKATGPGCYTNSSA